MAKLLLKHIAASSLICDDSTYISVKLKQKTVLLQISCITLIIWVLCPNIQVLFFIANIRRIKVCTVYILFDYTLITNLMH